jgi:membrane-bound lytic murein transglycosylase D
MKRNVTILVLAFFVGVSAPRAQVPADTAIAPVDTVAVDEVQEDALIDEVIKNRTPPKKDRVQYFSQVTRYGFKNLFANYSYNPALPYSSQVNPYAESYMQDYLKAHGKTLLRMKGWGQPYFNLIDNILMQYGLPRELKYLAVIESHLSSAATSWVGAGGPWQFMPYTAREYGLVVNGFTDERRDYYKSTHAAARYLLTLYRQTKDWLLVIAAYNGGPGRVFSAIKRSGSRNFWALQYHLPQESRNHVKKFIATHYIMEGTGGATTLPAVPMPAGLGKAGGLPAVGTGSPISPHDLNKPKLTPEEMEEVEVLGISGKYNSTVIAKNLAMEIARFNHYNPSFDNMLASNGTYDLRLPADKMQQFIANKYQILNECVQVMLNDVEPPIYTGPKTAPKGKKKKGRV